MVKPAIAIPFLATAIETTIETDEWTGYVRLFFL